MKKILLTTFMFLPEKGGAQYYYYNLCKNIKNSKIYVLVGRRFQKDEEEAVQNSVRFRVYYENMHFGKFIKKWLSLLRCIFKHILKHNIDILWSGEILPTGLAVYVMSRIYNIPYFVSTHGSDILNPLEKRGIKGVWKRFIIKFVLSKSAFITANTEYVKKIIVDKYKINKDKIVVVYPCSTVETDISKASKNSHIQTVEDLKKQGWYIVFTNARLVKRKGVDMVIKAMELVWKKHPNTVYVVTGDGTYKGFLEDLSRQSSNKDKIIFTGFVSDGDLSYLYYLSDLFIMPTRKINGLVDGFGIVYLNAGFFSKPVIGTDITGVSEAIIDYNGDNLDKATGFLLKNPEDIEEIADKIIRIIEDDKLAKIMGENNCRYAKSFLYSKEAEKIEKNIEKII